MALSVQAVLEYFISSVQVAQIPSLQAMSVLFY